jgi:hypothetical protein
MKFIFTSALLALPIAITSLSLPTKASALDILVRPSIPVVASTHRVWVAGHWTYTRTGHRYWVPGHYAYV